MFILRVLIAMSIVVLSLGHVSLPNKEIKSESTSKFSTSSLTDAQSVGTATSDVIRKFYIKNNIKFDVFIYGESSNHINDVINGVTRRLSQDAAAINLKHITNTNLWNHEMSGSAIFFVKSMANLKHLHERSTGSLDKRATLANTVPERLKFLVYVEEVGNIRELRTLLQVHDRPDLQQPVDLRFFEYFITNEATEIRLTANVLYSQEACGVFVPQTLNTFDKGSQKWIKKLENFEHFDDFHGCKVDFITKFDSSFYVTDCRECTINNRKNDKRPTYGGAISEVVNTMAQRNNFEVDITGITSHTQDHQKQSMIIFNDAQWHSSFHSTSPHSTTKFYYLISLNDLYTNYEKLMFPFDMTTWLLLFFTFGLTFGIILGLNGCSNKVKDVIYGKDTKQPAYNALAIAMGMSQVQLPEETFARIVWLNFIWFCFIFRTCWQSMMFEFMTTDMRKPLPTSIEDLTYMNYTIVLFNGAGSMNWHNELSNDRGSTSIIIPNSVSDYIWLYQKALDGESKYAFMVEPQLHAFLSSTLKRSLPILQNEGMIQMSSFQMNRNNILLMQLSHVVDRLVPAGIPQYLEKYGMWYLFRPLENEIEDTLRILSLSDLEFGFVIWLIACFISLAAFVCELLSLSCMLKLNRQLRKLIGLFDFLKALRARMAQYHDKW